MAVIRNNNADALQIGGVKIPARGQEEVQNWDSVLSKSRVVQAWVRGGILQVVGDALPPVAETEATQEAVVADESTERAELFAALSDLGIKAGGRTGTDKLLAMLADARAANADSNTEG